ncbi:phosphatidylserine/phosphatidylglycerophosphate/cardiolipin synthase family protein [Parasphingopyxis sp.]|uniref:phospholipase D-like domain-containing protein n=1 Tax=Parasphingopyxis sp. TaxID=1920299 RepID=UPI002604AC91|nr:phosphatidylserine/phosphatidylglycerophosphate/cardiolipin synthase family protein [Parasphingopyxis sp.]
MADRESPDYPLPPVDGHRFRLLADGPERLEALIALIDGAQRSVRLLYYIFVDDAASARVRDALIAAQRRGVDVALLVDGFGSSKTGDAFFAPLVESDCTFCRYEPKRSRRYLLRNHQKMAIADEATALIGGFNVEQSYFVANGTEDGWRDLGLTVEGPVAACLAAYFDDILRWSMNVQSEMEELRAILRRHHQQDGAVRLLLGGPTRELSPWAQALQNDFGAASRIDIAAAYFAPYAPLMRPIRHAALNGRSRIITAAKSDNAVPIAAARNRYRHLLPEVEIYEYQPMMLHTKLYVVDDIVYIGSANFDVRSLYLNLEVMVRIRDAGFADMMRRLVDNEIADSIRITPEKHARRQTLWRRIKGRISYFLMSVLDYNVSRRLNFGIDGQ